MDGMIRLLGAVCMTAAAAMCGLGMKKRGEYRTGVLRKLIYMVSFTSSEIMYRRTPLGDIFARLADNSADSGEMSQFFKAVSKNSAAHSFRDSFCDTLDTYGGKLMLEKRETIVLTELAGQLGVTDASGQSAALKLAETQLSDILAEAESEQERKGSLYLPISLAIGAVISIALL